MRHACRQTGGLLEEIGGNVHLIRMPGDRFPEKLDERKLKKRISKLGKTIQAAGIKEEANICFQASNRSKSRKRQDLLDQLDSCEAVMSYFEKSGKKTLPNSNKTRADAQQQLMITGKRAHKLSIEQATSANKQECMKMWSDMIYKYNTVSRVQWMQCCQKRIPRGGIDENKVKGRLLRQCAR